MLQCLKARLNYDNRASPKSLKTFVSLTEIACFEDYRQFQVRLFVSQSVDKV
jgi:hypothetical protein